MNSKKQEELEKELKEIRDLFSFAQESFYIVKSLATSQIGNSNYFFFHTQVVNWRITVLELSKLFADRKGDRFNLNHFIDKLKKNGYYGDANIPDEMIMNWEKGIRDEKDAIKNLIAQRDTIYAHKDVISKRVANKVSIQKTDKLITLVYNIIDDIMSTFNQTLFRDVIGDSPSESLNDVLNIVTKEKLRLEKAIRKLEEENNLV